MLDVDWSVCAHMLKHKDESVEARGVVVVGGRSVVLYISKALGYVPPPLSTSRGV